MTDINRTTIVGRLTRDSELKYTTSGTPVCKFSIAVNKSVKKNEEWTDEVSYFNCVLWGKTGEALSKYLTKGKQVAIDGNLHQNRWEKDGQQRSDVQINVDNIQLVGGNSEGR